MQKKRIIPLANYNLLWPKKPLSQLLLCCCCAFTNGKQIYFFLRKNRFLTFNAFLYCCSHQQWSFLLKNIASLKQMKLVASVSSYVKRSFYRSLSSFGANSHLREWTRALSILRKPLQLFLVHELRYETLQDRRSYKNQFWNLTAEDSKESSVLQLTYFRSAAAER